jgi:hydroxymethylpyrimidine pyrophosphatase-like HAD family hydrolase
MKIEGRANMRQQAADYRSSRLDGLPIEPRVGSAARADPLLVTNLLGDLDDLVDLLAGELKRPSWLNAFLLAAGLNQIAEDHLHESAISVARVARHVKRVAPWPLGSVAMAALGSAGFATRLRRLSTGERRIVSWQRTAEAVVDALADAVVMGEPLETEKLADMAAGMLRDRARLPVELRASIVRLPSCFRNFDQQPADLERMTLEFSKRWPDRDRSIAVVGVRTSGSYTAPLHGAYLRAMGYTRVRVMTYRPGQRWGRPEAEAIARVVESHGLALITDDAPKSGGSVARTAAALEQIGLGRESIVVLLQTLAETPHLPARLDRYASVVLPWPEWSVRAALEPEAVQRTIGGMLGPATEVVTVVPQAAPSSSTRRGHVKARYRVRLRNRADGDVSEHDIYVKGVGLAYLGDHAMAVVRPLQSFFPQVIGVKDGLMYRQWLPSELRLGPVDAGGPIPAEAVVRYAVSRAQALPVKRDFSRDLLDRGAVWQRAADIVARAFGIGAQFARPVLYPLVRALLGVDRPSVIDGSTDAGSWFDRGDPVGLRTVDFDDGAFNSLDIYCYDHVFDVAGFAPGSPNSSVAPALRSAYAHETGASIDPERWLLYRLVHVVERHRDEATQSVETERELSRELQQYYRETVFADIREGRAGPLCVFDVDWVLETRNLGFPGITPAAAFALHALGRHGYRVALASGRSISEVRERCRNYRLVGGVAEYGAFAYDAASDQVRHLLSRDDRKRLDLVRELLSRSERTVVDPEYRGAVRAYSFDDAGRRRCLPRETIAGVLMKTALEGTVRVIEGKYQTDFMVNTVDKGAGLRALVSGLGDEVPAGEAMTFALAVGDSAEDIPMMKLARLAIAPANADRAVRAAGIRIARRANQLGLAQAVAELIGHAPGACPECETTHLTARSRLLLSSLGAQDAPRIGKVLQALRLASRLARHTN